MSNVLKPKRSWTANAVPTTSDLVANEVAFNFADSKLFTRNPTTGNIVSVALGGGGSSSIVTASTVAGFPATGTAGILYVALDTARTYQWQGAYLEVGAAGGSQWSSVPASATATGSPGQTAYDGSWYYVCTATNTWSRFAASNGPWPSYLLSQSGLTSPVAAYSMRRLSGSYSGACLRVQRSSDSTQADIYFSGDWVDSAALYSFVGSGTGYVIKWYDQSGNGNHLGDTTYSNASDFRPRVVNAGSAITIGSRPAIDFTDVPAPNTAGRGLECRGLSVSSANWLAVGVVNYSSASLANAGTFSYGRWISVGSANTADYNNASSMCAIMGTNNNSDYPNTNNAISNNVRTSVSISSGNRYVMCTYKTGSSMYARANNTTSSSASVTGSLSASVIRLGLTMYWGTGNSDYAVLGGQIQETVFYATEASSVVSTAVANVNSSWGVF